MLMLEGLFMMARRRLMRVALKEVARFRICPREGQFGIQIPKGAWHSIEVHEPSAIFEAKDGAYAAGK